MSYEVLARKWRPQSLPELVGQTSIQRTLTNALKQDRLYPVLLFTGPRGTGKTSTARILAKTLRCHEKKDNNPCNQCQECLLIQEGKSLDVIEIDGASNNGVDAIRELRDTVNYMPSKGSLKIYIIDEVHMLSNSAFNALLKTLEEPPSHVIFIMATTESHKIPKTVESRCQKLDFHLIAPLLIKEHLEKICKKEKIPLKEEALWLIAKQSKGSLRDAQSLLDQMITFCGEEITTEKITELLGLTDTEIIFKCLESIVKRDEQQMLEVLKDLYSKGNEPKLILQNLIEGLRNLLILKINPENNPPLIQSSKQEIKSLEAISANSSYEDLHFLFDMLLKGEQEISFSFDSRMVLEVLLLRFCQSPRIESILPFSPVKNPKEKPSEKRNLKTESKIIKKASKEILEKQNESNKKASEKITKETPPSINSQNQKNFDHFGFLDFLKKADPSLASLFEHLSFKEKNQNTYIYFLPESFSYMKKKLTETQIHQFLERKLNEYFDTSTKVSIKFEPSSEKNLNLKTEKKEENQRTLLKQVKEDPFIKEVTEVFQGNIKAVSTEVPDSH